MTQVETDVVVHCPLGATRAQRHVEEKYGDLPGFAVVYVTGSGKFDSDDYSVRIQYDEP